MERLSKQVLHVRIGLRTALRVVVFCKVNHMVVIENGKQVCVRVCVCGWGMQADTLRGRQGRDSFQTVKRRCMPCDAAPTSCPAVLPCTHAYPLTHASTPASATHPSTPHVYSPALLTAHALLLLMPLPLVMRICMKNTPLHAPAHVPCISMSVVKPLLMLLVPGFSLCLESGRDLATAIGNQQTDSQTILCSTSGASVCICVSLWGSPGLQCPSLHPRFMWYLQELMALIRRIVTKHLKEIYSKETKSASCTGELQGI